MSEVELHSLRKRTRHDEKELASYKELTRTNGRRVQELEEKMKDMERKFEANKALIEREFHTSQLESTDAAFKRGHQAMASL